MNEHMYISLVNPPCPYSQDHPATLSHPMSSAPGRDVDNSAVGFDSKKPTLLHVQMSTV